MAKTVSQRQAEYRARRSNAGLSQDGERRLNMWISTNASLALARLAAKEGVSKRFIIERLVQSEDQKIINSIPFDTKEWDEYFLSNKVTQ